MALSPTQRDDFQSAILRVIEEYREKAYNQHLLCTPQRETFGWNIIVTSKAVHLWNKGISNFD